GAQARARPPGARGWRARRRRPRAAAARPRRLRPSQRRVPRARRRPPGWPGARLPRARGARPQPTRVLERMAKKRIGDIAQAHDLNPKEVVKQLQEAGFSVQSPTSTIEERLALKVLNTGGNGAQTQAEQPAAPPQPRRVQPAGSQP